MTTEWMHSYTPNRKVLYVDDEEPLLAAFRSLLRKDGMQISVLQDSQCIERTLAEEGPFAVVVSDQRMPVVDGVSVLTTVAQSSPSTIRILLTGYANYEDTIRAVNFGGISRYIAKPWKDEELRQLLHKAIRDYNLEAENEMLMGQLKEANGELRELVDGTVTGMVKFLSDLLGYICPAAAAQVARVRRMGLAALTCFPDLAASTRWEVEQSLDLFNLGIAVLPAAVLASVNRSGLDTVQSSMLTRAHSNVAASLLQSIPRFDGVARNIRLQEKNFDGTGEPSAAPVKGANIPMGARLLHILVDGDRLISAGSSARDAITKMSKQPRRYDVEMIRQMLGLARSDESTYRMNAVMVRDLRPGMVVLEDIMSSSGLLLLGANAVLTDTSIHILLEWNANDPIAGPLKVMAPSGGT
jgi:response regulator RpfG family c-di-GMP phosphodiesterase